MSDVCRCMDNYYEAQNGSETCYPCDKSCKRCYGPGKFNCSECYSDVPEYHREQLDPKFFNCPCKIGYSDFGEFALCLKCNYRCTQCLEPNTVYYTSDNVNLTLCTKCPDNSNRIDLSQQKKQCPCSKQYYDDGVNTVCQPCPANCIYCQNGEICTECDIGYILHRDNHCYNYCPMGQYSWPKNLRCEDCHGSCLICNGPDVHDCLACKDGYVFNEALQICLICSVTDGRFPLYVEGNITCECNPSLYRTENPISGNTSCVCMDGYYESNGMCEKCQPYCQTCETGVTCLTCNQTLKLIMYSNGVCDCEEGYTLIGVVCEPVLFDVNMKYENNSGVDVPIITLRFNYPINQLATEFYPKLSFQIAYMGSGDFTVEYYGSDE